MRANCTARRPNVTLEDIQKVVYLFDMACTIELNKAVKKDEKI